MIHISKSKKLIFVFLLINFSLIAQFKATVPPDKRSNILYERAGQHDANNIRTIFQNYGMIGDYFGGSHDISVNHTMEIPKGSGTNYTDGATPFILAKIPLADSTNKYIMITGFRERQEQEPFNRWIMRLEPRPGYFQADPTINRGRSPAISNDIRTWPDFWYDKLSDTTDPGWKNSWYGYFGKRPAADQESFFVVDDNYYSNLFGFNPDVRDATRRGLATSMEIRGFQWSNLQSGNVLFYHYDVINEGTTNYDDNIFFGIYVDSGVGGSTISCDGIYESDDDNAYFVDPNVFGVNLNLTYTWDSHGTGVSLKSNCAKTGYLGYAYLETPGNPFNLKDDDLDGINDEKRDGGAGVLIQGANAIKGYANANFNMSFYEATYGKVESRPAFKTEYWWTGDEDMDWTKEFDDTGVDGIFGTNDEGENDSKPTMGEPNFDKTDIDESDQIGLTGFKMNRIAAGQGASSTEVDGIVFYNNGVKNWPKIMYEMWTDPTPSNRYSPPLVQNYNIGFFFTSGPFKLKAGKQERFSLALAYGDNLDDLRTSVKIVQKIYASNYQFVVPPLLPKLSAQVDDKKIILNWSDYSERSADPVTKKLDFEGYKIYRSTDPDFLDSKTISNALGTGKLPYGTPIAQFDLDNEYSNFSQVVVNGTSYFLGNNSGLTHTFVDTNVTNGMTYYYAVVAYDHGDEEVGYFPSENSITVSRTPRGGIILPKNVVEVRPNPKAIGYTEASLSNVFRKSGNGFGEVSANVINSNEVPDNRTIFIKMKTVTEENIHADYYQMIDSADGKIYLERGEDFKGTGNGAIGSGIIPIVKTISNVEQNLLKSGFKNRSDNNPKSNLMINAEYVTSGGLPINIRRKGFPDTLEIEFSDQILDTSLSTNPFVPVKPIKNRVYALTSKGKVQMKVLFFEPSGAGNDSVLSVGSDILTILTTDSIKPTWRLKLDSSKVSGTPILPKSGDVFRIIFNIPFQDGETFSFKTTKQQIDNQKVKENSSYEPYVVPNPYIAAAGFEPERFAVSGRGVRRLEFRGLPSVCTIRIYTIRGELVQKLEKENSLDGYLAWNLRSKDNLEVAPGLYIFHIETELLKTKIGKFAIIK